jgi:hypothetical protein
MDELRPGTQADWLVVVGRVCGSWVCCAALSDERMWIGTTR